MARAPAAFAAALLVLSAMSFVAVAAIVGWVVLAAGSLFLGSGRAFRGRWVWAVICVVVGIRLLTTVGTAKEEAARWSQLAAEGDSLRVRATLRIRDVGDGDRERWTLRGRVLDGSDGTKGTELRWAWNGSTRPRVGERWTIEGWVLPEPLRPGPFPPPGLSPGGRRGVLRKVDVHSRRDPEIPLLASANRHLSERIGTRFGETIGPFVRALLLGDRGHLDPALRDAFATTGTLHVLAVSGLHVGFLAALLILVLRLAGVGPKGRALVVSLSLIGYAVMVGGRPSVVRATTMTAALLLAAAGERRVSAWQVLGVSGTLLLAWRPLDAFDLGFQFSFCAVSGLLALGGPLGRLLSAGVPTEPGVRRKPFRILVGGIGATVAASIGTLPVQAATFGWIAPVGFAVNPIVVPLAAVGLPLAWSALIADAVGIEPLTTSLVSAAGTVLGLLMSLVVDVSSKTGVWVPGAFGWAAGSATLLMAGVVVSKGSPGVAAMLAGCGLGVAIAARPPEPAGWEVVWLDVGQGDAIALHFPDGKTWVVDAGRSDPFGDDGRRVVLPYLRRRGADRIEWLITTHPDLDHVGGAASVVRGISVAHWASAGPVGAGEAYLELLSAMSDTGAPRAARLQAGDRLAQGGVSIDVLHPTHDWVARDPYASRRSPNEGSVVLLLSRGPCRLLLTGDLGRPAEEHLSRLLGDSLGASLLHVGHHGSRHSATLPFLLNVRPRTAVVSVGRGNRYGHPHADALGRLNKVGAEVFRTDRMGPITARCTLDGWHVAANVPYLASRSEK